MSKIMDDRLNEVRLMTAVEIAIKCLALGKLTKEDISEATGLSLKNVQELSEQTNIPA